MITEETLKDNQIVDITLRDNKYTIEVPVKSKTISDLDEYYFTLEKRDKDYKIYMKASIKNKTDEYLIFNLSFSFEEYKQDLLNNEILDLYINHKQDNKHKKLRIKSNQDNHRILAIVTPKLEEMFYPYTTKNGYLSFRVNNYHLFADFDDVKFIEGGFDFSGYFIYTPMFHSDGYKVLNKELIVTNNLDNNEIKIPLEDMLRQDIYDKYNGNDSLKETGFKGRFNIEDNIISQKKYHKFYLELTFEKEGVINTVRSTRMRYNQEDVASLRKVMQLQGIKVKVIARPTKKSKYFSLQLSKYNFKNEVIQKARTKWIKIRRGNLLKRIYKSGFYILGKLLPVDNKLVVFESFLGKQYSDSPRAIYEYMVEHYPDYDMYWSVDREHLKSFKNIDVKYVRRFSVKWLLLMTRARYWVTNSRLPLWIPKPRGTKYLQTWHGTPLKRLAADMDEVHMPGTNTERYKQNFLKEASKWDYLVSPNAYSTEIFKRAFQFDKLMVESGYPRNDFLINCNNKESIMQLKNLNHLPKDKKIILYAPTWRDNQFYAKGQYRFDLQMDLDKLRDELGDKYVIVLRLHYLVAENLDLTSYENFVFDFSHHEDIRELYLLADLLITDYSSVFFDYANLKRPMLFYVYDIEDYRDNLRGFYFDFESKAPGPLVKTTEEIITEINKIDQNGFRPSNEQEAFYEKFCYLEDGQAAERVVKKVFQD